MADVNQLVERAIAAYKAKQKSQARELLMQAVDIDDKHEQAWLWLSAVVDSAEDQQVCLENVLTINPKNDRARKGLEELYKKQGKTMPPQFANPSAAPRQPSASPSAGGWDSEDSGWSSINAAGGGSSNPFAGTGFDANPWGSDSNDALYGTPAPDAPATSVEWNKGGDKSAYGSGRQVAQPSSDEYDQWLASLNLGQGPAPSTPAAAPSSPTLPTSNPWDAPSTPTPTPQAGAFASDDSNWDEFSSNLNAAGRSQPTTKKDSDPFGGASFSTFEDKAEPHSPFDFDAPPKKAAGRTKAEEPIEPFQVTTRFSDFTEDEESAAIFDDEPPSIFGDDDDDPFNVKSGLSFDDDDDDPFAGINANVPLAASKPAKTKAKKSNTRRPTISPEEARYYGAIPADITAKAKSGGQGMLVMSTLILLILNVVALIGIVMSL
ncbi:MAG: hypothetical protein HY862_13145 [Chloroflexi bacterium]|nr:hypothetical protein [Chloroflexota bacterium]